MGKSVIGFRSVASPLVPEPREALPGSRIFGKITSPPFEKLARSVKVAQNGTGASAFDSWYHYDRQDITGAGFWPLACLPCGRGRHLGDRSSTESAGILATAFRNFQCGRQHRRVSPLWCRVCARRRFLPCLRPDPFSPCRPPRSLDAVL